MAMENRPYFVLGDAFCNALVGALSGWAGIVWMPHALGFWPGMLVSMAGAMAVTMALALTLFLRWFGAHEVMVPTMIGGMTANMTVCAIAHHHGLAPLDGAWMGALIGLAVLAVTYVANARLTREA